MSTDALQFQQAVTAIKLGDKTTGQRLLAQIIRGDPDNSQAWLWMSGVVNNDEQRHYCLERVLRVNPAHCLAKRGLLQLEQKRQPKLIAAQSALSPTLPAGGTGTDLAVQRQAAAAPTASVTTHHRPAWSPVPEKRTHSPVFTGGWLTVWFTVLTQPTRTTFERLARACDATAGRAYTWTFVSALIGGLASVLWWPAFVDIASVVPLFAAIIGRLVGFAIHVGFLHWLAGAFGGRGDRETLAFVTAAYAAPLFIIVSALDLVPYGICLSLPLAIYELTILRVVSIKAVYKLGWLEAILCAMPGWIVAGLLFAAGFLLAALPM
ncbi:MAG: YIP1 family protein [Anaerolineae bacterium]|nr:YIP1 family protein [Anaerolineae bacterium]